VPIPGRSLGEEPAMVELAITKAKARRTLTACIRRPPGSHVALASRSGLRLITIGRFRSSACQAKNDFVAERIVSSARARRNNPATTSEISNTWEKTVIYKKVGQ
jgi:hypothetical protein